MGKKDKSQENHCLNDDCVQRLKYVKKLFNDKDMKIEDSINALSIMFKRIKKSCCTNLEAKCGIEKMLKNHRDVF